MVISLWSEHVWKNIWMRDSDLIILSRVFCEVFSPVFCEVLIKKNPKYPSVSYGVTTLVKVYRHEVVEISKIAKSHSWVLAYLVKLIMSFWFYNGYPEPIKIVIIKKCLKLLRIYKVILEFVKPNNPILILLCSSLIIVFLFWLYHRLKRTTDMMFGGKQVLICGYGEVRVQLFSQQAWSQNLHEYWETFLIY